MEKPRTPGRRLFIAGTITLLLFSTVHLIPLSIDIFGTPTDPLVIQAEQAMRAVAVDIGPFHSDYAQLTQLLSVCLSVMLYFVVALNLVALPAVAAPGVHGRLRAMAAVNAIFSAIILATAVIYQFPPPGVFALVAMLFFLAAMMKAK